MIKIGIIGATGYAGAELVRLLLAHPEAEIVWLGSHRYAGEPFAEIYPNLTDETEAVCGSDDLEAVSQEADLVFTATPQGVCAGQLTASVLEKTKIIDLSADFRFQDVAVYEQWYGLTHAAPQFLSEAVYGLCEIHREKIQQARLVANPGCYTTCSILTLWPLLSAGLIEPGTLIIDAKSGVSGAGRSEKLGNLFCEVNENCKAYGVGQHRHTPEIEEQLSLAAGQKIVLQFTPHLIPMNRGILTTAYAQLKKGVTAEQIQQVYEKQYQNEPFIRLLGEGNFPETRWVEGCNRVDIGFYVDPRTDRLVALGALDNLGKGAAGQAVQNMNLMFGFPETTGLTAAPLFP